VLFGSFVRGQSSAASDLDVIAVRPRDIDSDDTAWHDSLGHWSDLAARIAGNPVNLLIAGEEELPRLLKRKGAWRDAAQEGTLLIGMSLEELAAQ
jgi:predicted nucleotidyltransferase